MPSWITRSAPCWPLYPGCFISVWVWQTFWYKAFSELLRWPPHLQLSLEVTLLKIQQFIPRCTFSSILDAMLDFSGHNINYHHFSVVLWTSGYKNNVIYNSASDTLMTTIQMKTEKKLEIILYHVDRGSQDTILKISMEAQQSLVFF